MSIFYIIFLQKLLFCFSPFLLTYKQQNSTNKLSIKCWIPSKNKENWCSQDFKLQSQPEILESVLFFFHLNCFYFFATFMFKIASFAYLFYVSFYALIQNLIKYSIVNSKIVSIDTVSLPTEQLRNLGSNREQLCS